MAIPPVVESLDALIAEQHLLRHPFYQALAAGTLARTALERYAVQNYRHVDVFPRYITAIHCNCDDLAIRQELLENLIEEERGEENHPELWLRFTDALGLERNAVIDAPLRPATRALVDGMLRQAREGSVAEGLAALYAYEAQIPEVAHCELTALRTHHGIHDPDALKFFSVHMEADTVHRQVGRDILAQLTAEGSSDGVLPAAASALRALNAFLDDLLR